MSKEKKDWAVTGAVNRRANPKAVANNQMATAAMLDHTGSLANDPKYRAWKKSIPVQKEFATTNAEEAKKLGITRRQVSKIRNGKKKLTPNNQNK